MQTVFPIPVDTPVLADLKSLRLTEPWTRFHKALGDDRVEASIVRQTPDRKLKYTISTNLCLCTYYAKTPATEAVVLTLPAPALLPFDVNGVVYEAGTKQITVEPNTILVRFWYQTSGVVQ